MKIQRMSAPLGAIVEDLDVREIDPDTFVELQEIFRAHHVLVFRNQELTPKEHIAFGERWGELVRHPYAGLEDFPEIIALTNHGKKRDVNQHWHSDMTYNERPPKLTMLYALEAPEFGGDTAFANQHLAYEALSDGMRNTLEELQAVHSAKGLAALYGADQAEAPQAEHPVVRTHDETGNKALYVCRAFTQRFCGWAGEESRSMLDYLFQHAIRPEFQARHQWQAGDVAMWDNRSVLHFAVHDHGDEPRTIHRLQVAGPRPA